MPLKEIYNNIHDNVYNKSTDVIKFIEMTSSDKITPFQIPKIITYQDYFEVEKRNHIKISKYYGDLSLESYNNNLEKMKLLIKGEDDQNLLKQDPNILLKGFEIFNVNQDKNILDNLIIKEYTKNTFCCDLNRWLANSKIINESVAYFTSRLMYSLNSYAKKNKMFYYENNKQLYKCSKIRYSSLIKYEQAKGSIIFLPAFTSTTDDEKIAKQFLGNKSNDLFSVTFNITNICKSNWIPSAINIQNISTYKNEKEIVIQPFSFFHVIGVIIDTNNYIGEIYLESIGKTEILEEKIKCGKEIQYNRNENLMIE